MSWGSGLNITRKKETERRYSDEEIIELLDQIGRGVSNELLSEHNIVTMTKKISQSEYEVQLPDGKTFIVYYDPGHKNHLLMDKVTEFENNRIFIYKSKPSLSEIVAKIFENSRDGFPTEKVKRSVSKNLD